MTLIYWYTEMQDDDGECIWKFVKEIAVPKSAFFQDYSDIAIHPDGAFPSTDGTYKTVNR